MITVRAVSEMYLLQLCSIADTFEIMHVVEVLARFMSVCFERSAALLLKSKAA